SVDLALPRVIREGDALAIPVVVHNLLEAPRTVKCTTKIGGEKAWEWPALSVGSQGSARFDLPLVVSSSQPLALAATVEDTQKTLGDGAQRTLVPQPRGLLRSRSFAGRLTGEIALPTTLEGATTKEGLVLEIRRESGFHGPVISALDGLIQ